MARIPYHNADLDRIYTSMDFPLGAETEDESGREYVFVKYDNDPSSDSTTQDGVAGYLACGLTSSFARFVVTCDFADAAVLLNEPVGFLQAALTDGTYGWAQKSGVNRIAMLTGTGVGSGEVLIALSGTDGAVDGVANPAAATQTIVGTALAADSGTEQSIGTAFIKIP